MYLIIVGIMMVLAIAGLVVGVANDAVNFLNSLGSKVAPRYVIMIVAIGRYPGRCNHLKRYDGGGT